MTIARVVLQKAKPGVSAAFLKEWADLADGLKAQIPGLIRINTGAHNGTCVPQGYDSLLLVEFEDKAVLDTYSKHPAHDELVAVGKGKFEDAQTIIYDMDI